MDGLRTHYTKTADGINIAYQTLGAGPDLMFHFGWPSQLFALVQHPAVADFFRKVASFSRLILFDPRGQGLSDRGSLSYSFDSFLDDINAVLDATASFRCAHFGCHFGGRVALMYAATYPARTSAVATFGSHPATLRDDDYPWGTTPESLETVINMIRTVPGEDRFETFFHSIAPSQTSDPALMRWLTRNFMSAVSPVENGELVRSMVSFDVRRLLPSVHAPTVVMHRTGDLMSEVQASRYMAERIPGARFAEIPGQDSLPFFETPDAILGELEELVTGARKAAETNRVLSTVLFTDIVNSTPMAARLGDETWTDLLSRHDAIVDAELREHRGKKIKTIGDGTLATFDGPARAVRCAKAICDAVKPLGVEVRAGLHSGEIELLGSDIGGINVHIGQRVSGLAGASEVLVSSTVKDLVSGSGIAFDDRGTHTLKGIPDEWRLYAVES